MFGLLGLQSASVPPWHLQHGFLFEGAKPYTWEFRVQGLGFRV